MITREQVESLKLSIAPIDERACLLVESALDWIKDNTTLKIEFTDEAIQALPAQVRLFVLRYIDVMTMTAGVQSESIEGLSQSFSSADKGALLWQYAEELLGKWLVSRVRFVTAQKRW